MPEICEVTIARKPLRHNVRLYVFNGLHKTLIVFGKAFQEAASGIHRAENLQKVKTGKIVRCCVFRLYKNVDFVSLLQRSMTFRNVLSIMEKKISLPSNLKQAYT